MSRVLERFSRDRGLRRRQVPRVLHPHHLGCEQGRLFPGGRRSILRIHRSLKVSWVCWGVVGTGDAMCLKVFAEKGLTATTIETMTTEFRVIRTDTIANFKRLDIFTDSSDFTHRLMPRNQRKLNSINSALIRMGRGYFGDEFPIMDM